MYTCQSCGGDLAIDDDVASIRWNGDPSINMAPCKVCLDCATTIRKHLEGDITIATPTEHRHVVKINNSSRDPRETRRKVETKPRSVTGTWKRQGRRYIWTIKRIEGQGNDDSPPKKEKPIVTYFKGKKYIFG